MLDKAVRAKPMGLLLLQNTGLGKPYDSVIIPNHGRGLSTLAAWFGMVCLR